MLQASDLNYGVYEATQYFMVLKDTFQIKILLSLMQCLEIFWQCVLTLAVG